MVTKMLIDVILTPLWRLGGVRFVEFEFMATNIPHTNHIPQCMLDMVVEDARTMQFVTVKLKFRNCKHIVCHSHSQNGALTINIRARYSNPMKNCI